jgi:hypothetical protein
MATSHRLNKTVAPLRVEFTPSEVEGRSGRDDGKQVIRDHADGRPSLSTWKALDVISQSPSMR